MDHLIKKLSELDLVRGDFDYHATRVAMIIVFFVFSCQKWFDYEARALIPFISNGPLIFWLYPVFGVRGAAYFLGSAELLFGLASSARLLEQKTGGPGVAGFMRDLCRHGDDHSVLPRCLGRAGRRLSCGHVAVPLPHEGCRTARSFRLSAQAGSPPGSSRRITGSERDCSTGSDAIAPVGTGRAGSTSLPPCDGGGCSPTPARSLPMICVSAGLQRRLVDLGAVHAERPLEESRDSPALKPGNLQVTGEFPTPRVPDQNQICL
ncbi:hypothetical protein ABIF20_008725 [Bradyrhizobium japonicum]